MRGSGISICGGILHVYGRCDYACLLKWKCLLSIDCAIVEDWRIGEEFAKGGNGNGDGNDEYHLFHLLLESLLRGHWLIRQGVAGMGRRRI